MKKLNLNMYPLEINKIKAIEEYINKMLEELDKKEIIEMEEEKDELFKDNLD